MSWPHSNNKGARHAKRYQDIAELLRRALTSIPTMDVQQLESLSDVVSSITGFSAPERVPDQVFDSADQVEIVDLEPSDLLGACGPGPSAEGKGTFDRADLGRPAGALPAQDR